MHMQVVGSLTAAQHWDDDDSIDDDTNTDGGEVSRAGSELDGPGAGMQGGLGVRYQGDMGNDQLSEGMEDGLSDGDAPQSEDSGF